MKDSTDPITSLENTKVDTSTLNKPKKTETELAKETRYELLTYFLKRLRAKKRDDYPRDKELQHICDTLEKMGWLSGGALQTADTVEVKEQDNETSCLASMGINSLPFPNPPQHNEQDLENFKHSHGY